MKVDVRALALVLSLLSACASYRTADQSDSFLIHGRTPPSDSWNWTVAFYDSNNNALCGGTLVAPQWVVTAAHCVCGGMVSVGSSAVLTSQAGTPTPYVVDGAYVDPNYGTNNCFDDDVALLHLTPPGVSNATNLPQISTIALSTGEPVTMTGRGGDLTLTAAYVTIMAPLDCANAYNHNGTEFTSDMQCTDTGTNDEEVTGGDSGGPALTQTGNAWNLVGVIALKGLGQGLPGGAFTVFSKDSAAWIESIEDATNPPAFLCLQRCAIFDRTWRRSKARPRGAP